MTVLDSALHILVTLARLSIPLLVAWYGSRTLLDIVDDRGLFAIEPFRSLPLVVGSVIAGLTFAANGWLPGLSPWRLFDTSAPWHAPIGLFREALLDPFEVARFWGRAGAQLLASPLDYAAGLLLLGLAFGLLLFFAVCAWRSAWALVVLGAFLIASLAMAYLWHSLICLLYWTIHWLNFWAFGVLILLIEWRRKEKPAAGYQPS